jgi:hypothetical protein
MDTFFGVGLVGAVANSFVMPNMAAAVMDSSPPERRAQALVRAHFLCPPTPPPPPPLCPFFAPRSCRYGCVEIMG